MLDEKILEVINKYEHLHPECVRMMPKIRQFLVEGRREKAFRWLGFMQGVLYMAGQFTIEELANHNRPN